LKILAKLITILPKGPIQKWGLDFIRPIELVNKLLGDMYILITINYVTKLVEAQAFHTNIDMVITKFL
jgi:hypothetical protein